MDPIAMSQHQIWLQSRLCKLIHLHSLQGIEFLQQPNSGVTSLYQRVLLCCTRQPSRTCDIIQRRETHVISKIEDPH